MIRALAVRATLVALLLALVVSHAAYALRAVPLVGSGLLRIALGLARVGRALLTVARRPAPPATSQKGRPLTARGRGRAAEARHG